MRILLLLVLTTLNINRLKPAYAYKLSDNFAYEVHKFSNFINSTEFTPDTCPSKLNELYESLKNIPPNYFDLETLKDQIPETIKELFQARITLRHNLGNFIHNSLIPTDTFNEHLCVSTIRNAIQVIRYLEEYLTLLYLKFNPSPYPDYLNGNFPFLKFNPEMKGSSKTNYKAIPFQTGDIIALRGLTNASTAISQLPIIDGQVNHFAFVYVDPETKEVNVIEPLLEAGVITHPINEYSGSDENIRAVIYRFKGNQELAKLAATLMWNMVQKSEEPIPYDFKFAIDDTKEFNCVEIVRYGFAQAAKQLDIDWKPLPLFQSKLPLDTLPHFFKIMSVQGKFTFHPSDIEVDPRFEIVAEWTDYKKIRNIHYKDAVMSKMYEWMDNRNLNYKIDIAFHWWLIGTTIWTIRKTPIINTITGIKKTIPANMPLSLMKFIPTLDLVMNPMTRYLETTEAVFEDNNDNFLPLAPNELKKLIETYRIKDYEKWKSCKDSIFHFWFNPLNESWHNRCKIIKGKRYERK